MRQQVDKREDCPRNVTLVAAESETIGLFRVSFRSKTVGMRILSFSVSRHSDQRGQFGVVYDRQKRRVLAVAETETERERQRQRERDRDRETETERQRQRDTERERERSLFLENAKT